MDLDRAQQLFHLNHTEAALIANLVPRRQMLLKRSHVSKVLNLHVDTRSYWIYTNTPMDNARVRAAAGDDGLRTALSQLGSTAQEARS
jgi:hypothetical protein